MKNKCWVVKIGSALLTNNGIGIDKALIAKWAEQIVALRAQKIDVILVSSGSIVEGMKRLGWDTKPNDVHKLQAAAAVGQMGLIQAYESLFAIHDVHTAQILLTRENLMDAKRYENISATLANLLELRTVPIINENDTVATDEIKFGDNDTLAALVANLVNADRLVILTDQHGVFDDDPRNNSEANLIEKIHFADERLEQVAGKTGGALGSGGMYSKVMAAKQATISNTPTTIAWGREDDVLTRLSSGEHLGTLIHC
ncbi:MAG TPA: glutamate 5-kinase [Candidatus Thioglobus sp.]|nr:glutamate 5-kinase [Candidatus Thioglobus sp.]HIL20002.1 glutamate 5-kinase [Candidatus Thioglobus sp.]